MFVRTGAWMFIVGLATAASTLGSPTEVAAGGGGCHDARSTEGTGTSVAMQGACFQPTVLHTAPGQAVTWSNHDQMVHNIVSLGWGNATPFGQGVAFSYSFEKPGTYPYYCSQHLWMVGAIVVGDGRGTAQAAMSAPVTAASDPSSTAIDATRPNGDGDKDWLPMGIVGVLGLVVGGGGAVAVVKARR